MSVLSEDEKGQLKLIMAKLLEKSLEEFAEQYVYCWQPAFIKAVGCKLHYGQGKPELNEYLKTSWRLTGYEFISQSDIDARIGDRNANDYYINLIPVYTTNQKLNYNYYAILTAQHDDMIYGIVGGKELKTANLKNFQEFVGDWLYFFMDPKTRDKQMESMQPSSKKTKSSKKSKSTTKSTSSKATKSTKTGSSKTKK